MANPTYRGWTVLAAGALGLTLALTGWRGYQALAERATSQSAVTQAVLRWKHSYLALGGTQQRWQASYRSVASLPDLQALSDQLALGPLGLRADTDALSLRSVESVRQGNVELGLTRLCLSTGNDVFRLEADSYAALLRGLEALARRPDVVLDQISVGGEAGRATRESTRAQARLGNLCLLFRS